MGHILLHEYHWKPPDLVAVIEGIIHDHPRLDAFVGEARASLRQTGLLPQDRIWDYLQWRRDLDPPRFDHYHPEFVRLFQWEHRNIEHMPHDHLTSGALAEFPVVPGTLAPASRSSENRPLVVGSAAVPEPGTLTLGLAVIAIGASSVAVRWVTKLAHLTWGRRIQQPRSNPYPESEMIHDLRKPRRFRIGGR